MSKLVTILMSLMLSATAYGHEVNLKLEVGKSYKTRNGKVATIIYVNENMHAECQAYAIVDGYGKLISYTINGRYSESMHSYPYDLVSEYVKPAMVTGWMNVYQDDKGELGVGFGPWETKEESARHSTYRSIGQIYINSEVQK